MSDNLLQRAQKTYESGLVLFNQKKYIDAMEHFLKSVDQIPEAAFELGKMYHSGFGVKQNYERVLYWYQEAGERGDGRALNNLGIMYAQGDGVRTDPNTAEEYFRCSGEKGCAAGYYNLGMMYETGTGVSRNRERALQWYRLAAENGYEAAQKKVKELEA